MNHRKGKQREGWLLLYTGVYLCALAALALVMLHHRKSLLWEPDAIAQPYTVIGYVGLAVRNLLAGKGWPMLSFSLGQGMDLLTTCTYYGYTDPLTLLSALFEGPGVELAYNLIAALRLYLVGAAAGLYLLKLGLRGRPVAWGAGIYAFQGYMVHMLGLHPYFMNGALYLPLLLLGVERVLKERRWLLFTLVTALMLVVNFYFAYMNTVAAIVYILVRLLARLRERGVRQSARDGFTLLGAYLLGAALSAVVFLPVVLLYKSNSRIAVEAGYTGSMLHYGARYYVELLATLFAPWRSAMSYTWGNFAPLALLGLAALPFLRERRAGQLMLALALCLGMLCLPMAGYVMNGGAYVSNRWSYIAGLFVAAGSALGLSRLFKLSRGRRRAAAILSMLYAALLLAYWIYRREKKQLAAPALILLLGAALLLYDGGLRALTRRRLRGLMSLFLAGSCALYVLMGYSPLGYGDIRSKLSAGVYNDVASQAAGRYIDDDGVYRVGQGCYDDAQSSFLGYMGTSYYWSLVDGESSEYYQQLYMPAQTTSYHMFGLGGGAAVNAVAAVKYVTQQAGENWVIPYGFGPSGSVALPNGQSARVYENANALPLGYAFDRRMSQEEYDALPVEDKLQALTAYAICDSGAAESSGFVSGAVALNYAVDPSSTVQLKEHWIGTAEGDKLALTFEALPDSETYVIIEGLEVDGETVKGDDRGGVLVTSAEGDGMGNASNRRSNFYFPKRGCAFCLGSGPLKGCEMTFLLSLNYVYDSIRVVSVPLAGYRESVEARRAEGMTDVVLSNDCLRGNISLEGDRVLQIAVPYSAGWRAWVDGAEQPLFRCGGLYMGLNLGAGAHSIELRYVTPGIKAGAAISCGALLLTVILAALSAGRRRKERKDAR